MSRRRSMMSEQLKQEIAKELGVYDTVEAEGWGRRFIQRLWQHREKSYRNGGKKPDEQIAPFGHSVTGAGIAGSLYALSS